MIFSPLVSIPADEEAREDAPKSHLITKKDIKRFIFIVVPLLALILYFAYGYFKKISDWHVCASNMNSIYKAVSIYAEQYDDRFPPMASADSSTGTPYVTNGKVVTWVTEVFQYSDQRPEVFECPAASDKEGVPTEAAIHGKAGERAKRITINTDYGMYAGYASAAQSMIDRSGPAIFIGETSNFGANGSYDPMPFKDSAGNVVPYDGFSIGWDNSNVAPDGKTKFVTRLALPGSSVGDFNAAQTRHANGLHAIAADGSLIIQHAPDAHVSLQGGLPSGVWRTAPMLP